MPQSRQDKPTIDVGQGHVIYHVIYLAVLGDVTRDDCQITRFGFNPELSICDLLLYSYPNPHTSKVVLIPNNARIGQKQPDHFGGIVQPKAYLENIWRRNVLQMIINKSPSNIL